MSARCVWGSVLLCLRPSGLATLSLLLPADHFLGPRIQTVVACKNILTKEFISNAYFAFTWTSLSDLQVVVPVIYEQIDGVSLP